MRTIYLVMAAGLIALTGCDKNSGTMEEREERDPNILSGQQYMDQGNYDAAIQEFKLAMVQEPRMARPHLDLATIYQNYVYNPIHAIYHYDRYLELRPESEKSEFILEQRQKVFNKFAQTLVDNLPEVQNMLKERNTLVQQNNDLKRQLAAALKKQSAQPTTTQTASAPVAKKTVTQTVPKSTGSATQAKSASTQKHQIYHVVGGDTLSKIATKFYGDSGKWDAIYEANKDMMRSPGDLKVGQTLVIPALGN